MKVNRFIFYACSRTSQTIQTRVSIIFGDANLPLVENALLWMSLTGRNSERY